MGWTYCTDVTNVVTVTVSIGGSVDDPEGAVVVLEEATSECEVEVPPVDSPDSELKISLNCSGIAALFRDWSWS